MNTILVTTETLSEIDAELERKDEKNKITEPENDKYS